MMMIFIMRTLASCLLLAGSIEGFLTDNLHTACRQRRHDTAFSSSSSQRWGQQIHHDDKDAAEEREDEEGGEEKTLCFVAEALATRGKRDLFSKLLSLSMPTRLLTRPISSLLSSPVLGELLEAQARPLCGPVEAAIMAISFY